MLISKLERLEIWNSVIVLLLVHDAEASSSLNTKCYTLYRKKSGVRFPLSAKASNGGHYSYDGQLFVCD